MVRVYDIVNGRPVRDLGNLSAQHSKRTVERHLGDGNGLATRIHAASESYFFFPDRFAHVAPIPMAPVRLDVDSDYLLSVLADDVAFPVRQRIGDARRREFSSTTATTNAI
jgi:hypothetical protein